MPVEHKVQQGECISSIAEKYGLFPDTIWDDPANAELKEKRKDSDVLYPGDLVVIPDKRTKEEPGATETTHKFRKKGVPKKLRLQFLEKDEPRNNESYVLDIDGRLFSGTTDSEGWIEHTIPPNAKNGKVTLGEEQFEYILDLGHIDPIEEISGVQARLNNLGFGCGKVDGVLGPKTTAAIKQFQKKYSLTESGESDKQTQDKLKEIYGL
jgi:hypothetical protein